MGSTAKIIFSSILTISLVSMFLIFSMQKSAQLTLDGKVKDEIITNIQQKLETAETSANDAIVKNAQIPKLQTSIDTINNEKSVYKQQIDQLQQSLQVQLKKAAGTLSQFADLQNSYQDQQILVEKAKQTTEELLAMQALLNQRDEEKSQFLTDIEQKDRAITFYSEKVDDATYTIATIQSERSYEQINLVLVLDELAIKIQYITDLTDKIEQLTGARTLAGTGLAYPKPKTITTVTEIEALIKRLQLESAPPKEDPLPAAIAELEALKTTNDLLRTSINEQGAIVNDLNDSLQEKEDELSESIKQTHEIATPLAERITLLEMQLEEANAQNTIVSSELTAAQTVNTELGSRNNSLDTNLDATQVILEEALIQVAKLSSGLEIANGSLQKKTSAMLSLTQEMETVKLTLSETKEESNSLSSQYGALQTELAGKTQETQQQAEQVKGLLDQLAKQTVAVEESAALKNEIVQFAEVVAAKEVAIDTLTAQSLDNNTLLTSLQADLELAQSQTSDQQQESIGQEEVIAKLTEEVASTQNILDEQAQKLASTEEQLAALEANTGNATVLEEKILTLEATISENITEITALQAMITSLTEQRDQLLQTTGDTDNDGVSDANDSCPDSIPNATVNARGCEEDADKDGLVNRLDLCPDTGTDAAIDNAGCSEEQTIVILEGINFQFGTADLTNDAFPSLDNTAIILLSNPNLLMEVSGHTDSVGEKEANLVLSSQRAQAVMTYLISKDVAESRLQARGYGMEEPIADNTTKSGRAQNRRVELRRIEAVTPQQ